MQDVKYVIQFILIENAHIQEAAIGVAHLIIILQNVMIRKTYY